MRIKIISPDFVYGLLENPPTRDVEDKWKEEYNPSLENLKRLASIQLGAANLPSPLSRVGINLHRWGEFYSAVLWIEPSDKKAFLGLSGSLRRALTQPSKDREVLEEQWGRTGSNGEGYILVNNQPLITISRANNDRLVSIGTRGAHPRKFGEESFYQGIKDLEEKAGRFITACLKRAKKSLDTTIYLGP
jgi:hypothetical protein